MSVKFDAANGSWVSSASSITFSLSCSGENRYLIVAAGGAYGASYYPTATYNGVSLPILTTLHQNFAQQRIFGLVAPASGAHNVVLSFPIAQRFWGAAMSFTGVDQDNPLGTMLTTQSGSGDGSGWSLTPTTDPLGMVACGECTDADALSYAPQNGVTEAREQHTSTGGGSAALGYKASAAAATIVGYNASVNRPFTAWAQPLNPSISWGEPIFFYFKRVADLLLKEKPILLPDIRTA